ncbi:unnamed protein product [Musa hybrid cultivar]
MRRIGIVQTTPTGLDLNRHPRQLVKRGLQDVVGDLAGLLGGDRRHPSLLASSAICCPDKAAAWEMRLQLALGGGDRSGNSRGVGIWV